TAAEAGWLGFCGAIRFSTGCIRQPFVVENQHGSGRGKEAAAMGGTQAAQDETPVVQRGQLPPRQDYPPVARWGGQPSGRRALRLHPRMGSASSFIVSTPAASRPSPGIPTTV